MNNDEEDEAQAYCQPLVAAITEMVREAYLAGLKSGRETEVSRLLAELQGRLSNRGEAQAFVPDEGTRPPETIKERKPVSPPSDRPSKPRGTQSARSYAFDLVKKAHPRPVPSLTILNALRARDGGDKSTRRDDLFYKSMRRLREDGQIVLTDEGYVLKESTSVK